MNYLLVPGPDSLDEWQCNPCHIDNVTGQECIKKEKAVRAYDDDPIKNMAWNN